MRPAIALAILAGSLLVGPSAAAGSWGNSWSGRWNYPWCAEITSDKTTPECSYESQAQCLATVWGVGGMCVLNPWYVPPREDAPRRKLRSYPR